MKFAHFIVVFIVTLGLQWSAGGGMVRAQADLKATLVSVCQEEKSSVIFTSPNQVRELISLHEQEADVCGTRKFDEAFKSMKQLLDPEALEDICSQETYQSIRGFHLKFLHYYKPEFTRQELIDFEAHLKRRTAEGALENVHLQPIPEPLRRFFILFVKQINASCKQQIQSRLEELVEGSQSLISDSEFELIERYRKESRRLMPMAQLGLSAITKSHKRNFRDLEILNFDLYDEEKKQETSKDNFDAVVKNGDSDEQPANGDNGTKLYLLVKFNDRLKQIHDACQMKFKPIYDEVFAPVIKLNNLGYVDHLKSKHEDEELNWNDKMTRWYNIIEACEIMKDVEIMHDSTEMAALASIIKQSAPHVPGSDRSELNQVKLLSKEEADEFKARLASDPKKLVAYDPKLAVFQHKKVKFTPRMWLTEKRDIDDELYYLNKDLNNIISKRRSYIRVLFNGVRFQLKNFYYKHKKEISDRDQSSSLGRLSAFIERHQMPIRLVMLMLTIIFIAAHFG